MHLDGGMWTLNFLIDNDVKKTTTAPVIWASIYNKNYIYMYIIFTVTLFHFLMNVTLFPFELQKKRKLLLALQRKMWPFLVTVKGGVPKLVVLDTSPVIKKNRSCWGGVPVKHRGTHLTEFGWSMIAWLDWNVLLLTKFRQIRYCWLPSLESPPQTDFAVVQDSFI